MFGLDQRFEHPRVVGFLLQGLLLIGIGVLLRAGGRLVSTTLDPFGNVAILIGIITVALAVIAYVFVLADALIRKRVT